MVVWAALMGILPVSTFSSTEKVSPILKLPLPGERKREAPCAWIDKATEENNIAIIIEIIAFFII